MTPIGSTSSNIRRAIEFIVDPSFGNPAPNRTPTISWTAAHRETHRNGSWDVAGRKDGFSNDLPGALARDRSCRLGGPWRALRGVGGLPSRDVFVCAMISE